MLGNVVSEFITFITFPQIRKTWLTWCTIISFISSILILIHTFFAYVYSVTRATTVPTPYCTRSRSSTIIFSFLSKPTLCNHMPFDITIATSHLRFIAPISLSRLYTCDILKMIIVTIIAIRFSTLITIRTTFVFVIIIIFFLSAFRFDVSTFITVITSFARFI